MMTNAIATSRPISGGKPSAATGPEASDEHQRRQRAGQQEQHQQATGRDVGDRRRAGRGRRVRARSGCRRRSSDGAPIGDGLARDAVHRGGASLPIERPAAGQEMRHEARPAGLVRGADPRARCRRGSTRGTAAGRATRGRRGTSRCSRATGRWPSASGSQIETSRADRSAATSRRRRRRPDPVGYSTVNVSPSASSQRSIDSMNR